MAAQLSRRRKVRIGRSLAGLGLFARTPFKRGQFIARYSGKKIHTDTADDLNNKYLFEINSRWTIDGSSRWNVARYVNHSCRPNVEAIERKGPIIVYVARRRIKPEEEITVDYGRDYFDSFITKSRCQCAKCRERRAEQQSKYRVRVKRALMRKKSIRKRSRVIGAGSATKPKAKTRLKTRKTEGKVQRKTRR